MPWKSTGRAALDELFWRDEVLQAMFWMKGEGLADAVSSADLARFLGGDAHVIGRQMSRLVAGGYLERLAGRPAVYRLTEMGRLEGARSFRDEFADLTRLAHGECAPGCWCHDPAHAGEPCPSHSMG